VTGAGVRVVQILASAYRTVADRGAGGGARERDRGDAGVRQRLHLSVLHDAVAVEVAPDAQATEMGVIGVDDIVVVGIVGFQHVETILRGGPEQLRRAVDPAVGVGVVDENAVGRANPGRAFGDAHAVEIEIGCGGARLPGLAQGGDRQAFAGKVEN
jgi:hypothetical protein